MKKKLLVLTTVLVLVVSAFALTGCGGSSDSGDASEDTSWTYVEDKGELVVGLDDTFAPMGFRDEDGNLVGFDIDLATAVGEELGVSVKFQPINWDSKYMATGIQKYRLHLERNVHHFRNTEKADPFQQISEQQNYHHDLKR